MSTTSSGRGRGSQAWRQFNYHRIGDSLSLPYYRDHGFEDARTRLRACWNSTIGKVTVAALTVSLVIYLLFHSSSSTIPGVILPPIVVPVPNPSKLDMVSSVLGDLPGFTVLANVGFHQGNLYYIQSASGQAPDPERFMIDDKTAFEAVTGSRWAELIHNKKVGAMGSTIYLNAHEAPGQHIFLPHYYHFLAENVVGGITGLASVLPKASSVRELEEARAVNLVIPWVENYRDRAGMNEVVGEGLFPGHVIEKDHWASLNSEYWLIIERIVIVDRWVSHKYNELSQTWNRMTLPIFLDRPHPARFFEPYRLSLLNHFRLTSTQNQRSQGKKPKVVYIDRQDSGRTMEGRDHEELVRLLGEENQGGTWDVRIVKFEDLGKREQFEMVADADALIGVHGNGLTHEIWLPPGAVVMEFANPGRFTREFQDTAQVLGHHYYCIWDDHIHEPKDWNPAEVAQSGPVVPVNAAFVVELLKDKLGHW